MLLLLEERKEVAQGLQSAPFSPIRLALCSGEDGSSASVPASKAFAQWEAPWSCPCTSDFKEAAQSGDNRTQRFGGSSALNLLNACNWQNGFFSKPERGTFKPRSALVLCVLPLLGSSSLHLMCHRSKIQTSHWKRGGGRRVMCFSRNLSLCVSLRLLSFALQLQ